MPKINAAGLNLIENFEGCRLQAYDDGTGVWTIGWGHTGGVTPGERITQFQAEALLQEDLAKFEDIVQRLVEIELTPNQFAALVSFEYNTGALASSPGLALINQRRFEEAWDDHFCLYINKGSPVEAGLIRRRAAEKELFFTP